MKKILFLNAFYYPNIGGGAELTLKNLVQGLNCRDWDVVVASTADVENECVELVDGVKVYRVPVFNLYWHFKGKNKLKIFRLIWALLDIFNVVMAARLYSILKREKPDLLVFHNIVGWSSSVYWVAKLYGIRLVQVLHDYYNLCPNSMMFSHGQRCAERCTVCRISRYPNMKLSSNVDAVVGVSRFVLNAHLDNGFYSKARISTAIYNSKKLKLNISKPDFQINDLVFGFIGTLIPAKGLEKVITLFSSPIMNGGRLIIAGSGSEAYMAYLQELAGGRKNIEFCGHVLQDVFFPRIDVLIVPSIWDEPLGNVVFEAFAHGVPVLGAMRGGIQEMVVEGFNGVLFEPESIQSIHAAINDISSNSDRFKLLKQNAILAAKKFSDEEKWINDYISIFKESAKAFSEEVGLK